uniref:Uncharacterized protein n=1 Tax=Magallana gigas TaxID=29159 RepID=A0A8W8NCV7_MAGGI
MGYTSIWSSFKENFSPWIAYKGCYNGSVCSPNLKCHNIVNNTVGNCYFQCKSKTIHHGGCSFTTRFFFGLQKHICFCLCDDTRLKHISESAACNIPCRQSLNNGKCGGNGFFSVYESMIVHTHLSDTHTPLGGFCLTCLAQTSSNKTMLSSMDCNANAYGYCVRRNGDVLAPMMSTFLAYWKRCESFNMHIVGTTNLICEHKDGNVWTGLRRYKMDGVHRNDRCYFIVILQSKLVYKEGNCREEHQFICKRDIAYSSEQINGTENTASLPPSLDSSPATNIQDTTPTTKKGNKTTVVVASLAGVSAVISAVLLIVCMLKKRKQQQAKHPKVFDNSTYNDLTVTNERHDGTDTNTTPTYENQDSMGKIDDIYVGKEEEEYDHLHTSRQKQLTKETKNNEYGTACYVEDNSYSMLRQGRNPEPDLDNEYSTMPSFENAGSSVGNSEYDFCSK